MVGSAACSSGRRTTGPQVEMNVEMNKEDTGPMNKEDT